MKIAVLSTSATVGGAAIVTTSLVEALRKRGHEVLYLTMQGKRERQWPFLAERLGIFLKNGFRRDTLFKVSAASHGQGGVVEQVRRFAPDRTILGWVSQGFLSLGQIEELAEIAPTVWVMHDMWCFTGICHHSLGCMHFTGHCGDCPMLAKRLQGRHDFSNTVWHKKMDLYSKVTLHFVAVSSWVKDMARRSRLLRDEEVTVIPNVYPLHEFYVGEKEPGLIALGADRLDDPIKGLRLAVEALNRLPANLGAHVEFFGGYKDVCVLKRLKIPYRLTGPLSAQGVRELMARAQVVLSTAHYETLGNTLIEGQASGAVPVSFSRGGQVDIIDHKQSGFLADFGDVDAIARGIVWAMTDAPSPEALRAAAHRKFSADAVAARFENLQF